MARPVKAWRNYLVVVVSMALFLSSLPCVASLPQELHIKPARDSPRALYHPNRDRDTPLASLVETFAQNDLGKGHMFDLDLSPNSDTSEDAKMSSDRPPSPPKFNIDTFTFNEKNIRKPGDIFSLLADVESKEPGTTTIIKQKKETVKAKSETPKRKPTEEAKAEGNGKDNEGDDEDEVEVRIPGVEVVNTFGKKIMMATQDLQEFMDVVMRMKKKVETKLNTTKATATPGTNPSTKISLSSIYSSFSSLPSSLPVNASNLVSLLLDSDRLEEIRTAGLTSKTEDEFLDHLTSVLIGDETRNTALTLDPVTIIALLTLAAYLIRAVYQVLTVTGRSLDVADLAVPLHLADLPLALTRVHSWIESPDTSVVREKRDMHSLVGNILDIPGNLAAVIKLYREGHRGCVQPFVCQQIERRSMPDVTLTDMLIAGLGYYFGETNWAGFIDSTLTGRSAGGCDVLPVGCTARTLSDAHYLESLYTTASYKFFNLLAMITKLY